MKRDINPILLLTVSILLIQGCAPVLVGGAATGISVVHDRRSTGTTLDDQGIELRIVSAVQADETLNGHGRFKGTSYNNVVLLTGQAETQQHRMQFEALVQGIPNVKRIVNEVVVSPKLSVGEQSRDAYLTSKVKLQLFNIRIPDFDPTRVKVVTENGSVFLMGIVTQQEADMVIEEVRYIRGVRRVVKVFEYLT